MSHFDTIDGAPIEQLSGNGPVSAARQYFLALGLYLMWAALAWLSHSTGQTTVAADAAVILLAGIIATNIMFFALAHSTAKHWLPLSTVVLAQSVFGIAWVTLYSFLSSGPGEIVPFIYVTTLLFAISNIERRALFQLVVFSAASYGLVIILKRVLGGPEATFGPGIVQILVFAGAVAWILMYCGRLRDLRLQLMRRNASLQSIIDKMARTSEQRDADASSKRHYMMESLIREKGRTDRSNNPFSVCIFDMDGFDAFIEQHGSLTGERVLKSFAQRIRGALRAMDAANPSGFKRRFGPFANEEYIVILPQTGLTGAEHCAERICEAIRKRTFDDTYRQTVSGGVAEYKRGETIPELLARADEGLRNAKQAGGDRVVRSQPRKLRPAVIVPLRKLPS